MKKERFEAITDAVLAIIITLMILEIKIPELTINNISNVLQHILIYALSFTYIAILWLNHHHIFVSVKIVHINLVWINFGLLFCTSLLPLATEHISNNVHEIANHILFGSIMAVTTFLYTIIEKIVMIETKEKRAKKINLRNWISVIMFLISIPLSFVSIYLSGFIFIVVPLMYFLISKRSLV